MATRGRVSAEVETALTWVLLFCWGLYVVTMAHAVLPKRYFYDSTYLRNLIQQDAEFVMGDSYSNTALFYRLIGIGSLPNAWSEGILTYTLCFFAILIAWLRAPAHLAIWHTAYLAGWTVILGIFCGTLTKEVIVIWVVALALVLGPRSKKWLPPLLPVSIVALYALVFRAYWWLIVYFALAIYLYLTAGRRLGRIRHLAIILTLLAPFIAASILGQFLTDTRARMLNTIYLASSDVVTATSNLVANSSIWTDVLNTLWIWLQLMFPLRLVILAGVQHLGFAAWQTLNVLLILKISRVFSRAGWPDARSAWCISWMAAFTIVQAIFVPDFGTYARHQIALLPMFLYLLLSYTKLRRRELSVMHSSGYPSLWERLGSVRRRMLPAD